MRATPPMGWNSWDCYGTTVTEAEVLANAAFMAEHLLPYGWDTVVVDIDWSDPTARSHGYNADAPLAMDAHGRLLPDPGRFPSAADGAGFGPLAARVHALGLRFGIHTMRGIPRRAVEAGTPVLGTDVRAADVADRANVCEWNPDMVGLDHTHPGAQAYYDSTLDLYAGWGVDFLKSDDMLWPYQAQDIEAYARAIARTGRDIELSLSPGRDLSLTRLAHLREHATMWRICDDLWDDWDQVVANFARFARWAPHASPAGWPDGDMLPLGRIGLRAERGEPRDDRLTPAERVSLMTLWLIARSPLMIGGDLPTTDPATIALFTHADALAVLRSSGNREVFREGGLVVWSAQGDGGEQYVAVFNLDDAPRSVTLDAADTGLPAVLDGELREVWTGEAVGTFRARAGDPAARGVAPGSTAVPLTLAPHGAALLRHVADRPGRADGLR
ncbi:glycoside hydrolase family 27 protein [Cellulomonas sp. S1-8]|uniref:glycoside hydrolase family 27 protein n=1 Tax=Cellulomonas sp. S1-8 TaxID=2904790 RepID=UPI002243CF50|nr:glycoside hydrolase family 27 protein [Cellulomonas sp. S1-8]UZN02973.1 glycoside hydrolase family 27 protein [Cellulomonas sp. S1-8]